VQVVDIANPEIPHIVGSLRMPRGIEQVALAGKYVYGAGVTDLYVIDITDPLDPQIAGSVTTPDVSLGVAGSGSYVYIADGRAGLQILPGQCGAITPVLLTDLAAACVDDGIRISWRVSAGAEFFGFMVQRAPAGSDPRDFESLNSDAPVPGRGPWEYTDRSVLPGDAYDYRVLGLLPGEDPQFFGPVQATARRRSTTVLTMTPNPAIGFPLIHLRSEVGDRVSLRVFDAQGALRRTLLEGLVSAAGLNTVIWDGCDLRGHRVPAGIYYIQLEQNARLQTARVVVVK
jgi:hypothetical protein